MKAVDVIVVGGGLAGSLIAYRLSQTQPQLRLLVLERAATLGGNHTWSFHESDIAVGPRAWLAPFVVHQWPAYDVCFPQRRRKLGLGYSSITSDRLHVTVANRLGRECRFETDVRKVAPDGVQLASGEQIAAGAVIDGRGYRPSAHMTVRFQKFLGIEVCTVSPHGLAHPLVMDATVDQIDGYRFVYVLPLAPTRLLIEDTRYSDSAALDLNALRGSVQAYAHARGWVIRSIVREETGVLPVVLDGDIDAYWDELPDGVASVGMRAGLFHPTTGYSLADAVRLADRVARLDRVTSATVAATARAHSFAAWRKRRFYRALNRMLFLAARPEERYRVLQWFYRLPEDLIARFYAAEITGRDKVRLLTGWPPVPLLAGLRSLPVSSVKAAQ